MFKPIKCTKRSLAYFFSQWHRQPLPYLGQESERLFESSSRLVEKIHLEEDEGGERERERVGKIKTLSIPLPLPTECEERKWQTDRTPNRSFVFYSEARAGDARALGNGCAALMRTVNSGEHKVKVLHTCQKNENKGHIIEGRTLKIQEKVNWNTKRFRLGVAALSAETLPT